MFAAVYALGSAHFPASALGAADLALDAVVEVGLRREARRLVHLEQPGPELRVDEHVEALLLHDGGKYKLEAAVATRAFYEAAGGSPS